MQKTKPWLSASLFWGACCVLFFVDLAHGQRAADLRALEQQFSRKKAQTQTVVAQELVDDADQLASAAVAGAVNASMASEIDAESLSELDGPVASIR